MPTYIVLGQFTDQGIRNVKDTTKRATALKDMAKKAGATVKEGDQVTFETESSPKGPRAINVRPV